MSRGADLPPSSPSAPADVSLQRELGLFDSTMINVGTIIGSGIFIVPAAVAGYLHASALVVAAWLIGGVVSLFGALSVAELGAAMPDAGGMFVYLRRGWGPIWGYLYGWTNAVVINPASIAAIGIGFATYVGHFVPLSAHGVQGVAMASIATLTLINCLGLRQGAVTQNVLTLLKIGAVLGLVAIGFLGAHGGLDRYQPLWPGAGIAALAGPFGLAMVAVLWAYDGWIEVTYVGSEIRDPGRAIPRSIVASIVLVTGIYVLASLAFIYVLTPAGVARSAAVGADVATAVLGGLGAALIAVAIAISTLGANNGIIFTAARIPYAMARDAQFFRACARLHPRRRTPVVALVTQGIWACLLAGSGTYDQLITYVIFTSFIFYAMAAGAVLRLRRLDPGMERPYRTWGYPVTPLLFIGFALALVGSTILQAPRDALIGLALVALGLPFYAYLTRRARIAAAASPAVAAPSA